MKDNRHLSIEEKNILVIQVYPSQLKPHFLKSAGKLEGTYIRVGATNKKADAEYIQELERQRINISYDEDYWFEDENEDMTGKLIQLLEKQMNQSVHQSDLENFKLMKLLGSELKYTNAVPILLGLNDNV